MRFRGIHPDDMKSATAALPIEALFVRGGDEFYLALTQHVGAAAVPVVSPRQQVRRGELIAKADGLISANVHSPVDGIVMSIGRVDYPVSGAAPCIVIRASDGQEPCVPLNTCGMSLPDIAKSAGIVGMGGAMFPTHVKLSPKEAINTLIINGCECEPYLTCDHRLMLERTRDLVDGAQIIKNALNIKKVIFAVESNKADAAHALTEVIKDRAEDVAVLPAIYPQGGEKQLILSVTGIEVPEGKLPAAVSVLVHNVSTVLALFDAVTKATPLTHRVVTIPAGVHTPKNILAPLGTPVSRLIEFCGGLSCVPEKIVAGGPMTGFALRSLNVPVYKGLNGVLVFDGNKDITRRTPCIRCGRCERGCPAGLNPMMLEKMAHVKDYDGLLRWKLLSCIDCGACVYVCPSRRPLNTLFKQAKKETQKRMAVANG